MHLLQSIAADSLPSIIGITETWFDESSVAEMDGYQLFRKDRPGDKRGGGVCLYIKSYFEAFRTSEVSFLDHRCEQLWVTIKIEGEKPLLLGCIYRPPSHNNTNSPCDSDIAIANSIEKTTKLLRNAKHSGIILMGDFNLPQIDWNEDGAILPQNVLTTCNHVGNAISNSSLVQIVKEKTFFCNKQPTSQLDIVLVREPNRISNCLWTAIVIKTILA